MTVHNVHLEIFRIISKYMIIFDVDVMFSFEGYERVKNEIMQDDDEIGNSSKCIMMPHEITLAWTVPIMNVF